MKMLPFRVKMREAVKEHCEEYKLDETEVIRKLEIDHEKEKMTALAFHKNMVNF